MGPGNRGPSVHSVSDSLETATARAEDRAPAVGQNKKRWMLAVGNGVEPSTARVVDLEKRPAGVKRTLGKFHGQRLEAHVRSRCIYDFDNQSRAVPSALRSDFGEDGWRKGLDWAVAMLRAALFEGRGRSGSPFRAWKGDNSRRV
jgi:hypothetical protein